MDNTIISYLIKVSVALAIFYGVYILCLRTDTFLKLRRFYFLFAIAFSLAFPVFIIEIPVQEEAPVVQIPTYWLSEMNPIMVVAEREASTEIDVWTIVLTGLSIVSGIYAGRFMLQLSCILRLRIKNDSERFQSYRIVKMKEKGLSAFSFFNWIFINRDTQNVQKLDEIMRHEQVHAEQYHSIDTILSEILCICFWWNPFAWLIKREIKINLEYLADEGVLRSGYNSKEYQYMLLQVSNKNSGIQFINNFNVSQLKKRIKMMNKKRSSIFISLKYLLIIPVGIALLFGNAVQATPELINVAAEQLLPEVKQDPVKGGKVYTTAEQLPSYPGGETEMQKYIQNNLKYPVKAQEAGVQGRVVVRFVVTETGSIEDISIVRSVSAECDAEVIRIIKAMPKWNPGKDKGKAVPVYFNLPFSFKLSGKKSKKDDDIAPNETVVVGYGNKTDVAEIKVAEKYDPTRPFITVEQMPSFTGGETEMQKYIQNNLKYPVKAQEAGIQGRVTLRFIVSATGEIEEVGVTRGISPECDAEAVRVVKAMPKWNPGKQNGQAVAVYFNMPIQFKLYKEKSSKS